MISIYYQGLHNWYLQFVGIRIFQHLNLLLVCLPPISLMRNKPQNDDLYKTAFSPRLLRFQTSNAVAYATMPNGVFLMKVLDYI